MSQVKANQVAVITGAARGIGRRTAEVLAEKGYALALNDLSAADDTEKASRKLGAEVMQVLADVSIEQDVDRMADRVLEQYGRVDVVVNNAGISLIAPAVETSPQQWRRVLDINLGPIPPLPKVWSGDVATTSWLGRECCIGCRTHGNR